MLCFVKLYWQMVQDLVMTDEEDVLMVYDRMCVKRRRISRNKLVAKLDTFFFRFEKFFSTRLVLVLNNVEYTNVSYFIYSY